LRVLIAIWKPARPLKRRERAPLQHVLQESVDRLARVSREPREHVTQGLGFEVRAEHAERPSDVRVASRRVQRERRSREARRAFRGLFGDRERRRGNRAQPRLEPFDRAARGRRVGPGFSRRARVFFADRSSQDFQLPAQRLDVAVAARL
jgi:hypothetical protein